MGIRGLTSYLNKSATEQRLACQGSQCNQSPGVVIDGPSLAYWIHFHLVRGFIVKGETNTRPSLELIRRMILDFLETLEDHNLKVLHIYFDGGLPTWKRAIRFERLHRDHLQRTTLRSQQADFELTISHHTPFSAQDLLESNLGYPKTSTDLVTPFLVPLVIESLRKSRFSERIEIVPDEADGWCSAFAREHSATILTNDSDLAIHDLEEGQIIFLESLKRDTCEQCTTSCIMANILHPVKVVQMLSTKSIMHAAFELHSVDGMHKETLHHTPTKKHHISTSSGLTFQEFCARYPKINLGEEIHLQLMIQNLDPRLSEVVEQLERPSEADIISILPLLVEDPQKKSAWTVSESIRDFVYSLLRYTSGKNITVIEYIEKGQSSRKGKEVSLLNEKSCIDACLRLIEFLQMIRESSPNADNSIIHWRTVCSIHVSYHLLALDLSSPSEVRSQLNTLWDRVLSCTNLSWSQIHFRGQLEATYYAFRQLYQTLKYLESAGRLANLDQLLSLQQVMLDLPGVVDMLEEGNIDSRHSIDTEYIIKIVEEMLEDNEEEDR